jgi:replicative DNA helicase
MNLEHAFVNHLVKLESVSKFWDLGIRSSHFFDEGVKELFEYTIDYYTKSELTQTVTKDLLQEKFPDWFELNEWPQEEYLPEVISEDLINKYRRVRVQEVLLSAASKLDDEPDTSIREALVNLNEIQSNTSTRERMELYGDGFNRRITQYVDNNFDAMVNRKRGYYFGWDEIDEHMYGIQPSELAVVVGWTNVGKSWVGSKIAIEAARRGTKVYFASLELSKELTMMRLDCLVSGVPFARYERGQLTSEEIEMLKRAREEVESFGEFLMLDTPKRRDERTVLELYSRAKQWGAELFVGDQLSWLTATKNYGVNSNFQSLEMAEAINDVASLTREMKMASVWLAQFNRESMRTKHGRGGLEHIGLSSQVEQIVDWAFGISATNEMKQQEALVMEILKTRRSDLQSWLMDFRLKNQTDLRVNRVYLDD